MTGPPRVLVVDDTPANVRLLEAILLPAGIAVTAASSGPEALEKVAAERPGLVLLDVVMPEMDGYEVCRRLRERDETRFLPVVMVTASQQQQKLRAIEAGADDFITRPPLDRAELLARVRALLRVSDYQDRLAELNRTLEQRVREQVEQLDRLGRLQRFLSPQLAKLVVSSGDQSFLESHRSEIAVVFADVRGFTAFSETNEPEEVMRVLAEYHAALEPHIFGFEGTLEGFRGDGVVVFFNDPLPCPDAPLRAVAMAVAMRDSIGDLAAHWRRRGHALGFGVGIAQGYATIGRIGFEQRSEYSAIGSVVNLATRLCDQAAAGEVLISQPVYAATEDLLEASPREGLTLKGFSKPVRAYNVTRLTRPYERPQTPEP